MGRVAAFLACGFILTGCSSSLPSLDFLKSGPSTEALRIESEPPGAEAKVASGQSCRTPCELKVQPGSDASVTLALAGYQPHTVSLRSEEGESGKIGPNPVYVELKKEPPVASKKKKVATRKPKPATTTTAAVVTPPATTTASVPTPPPAAPAAEPALAPGGGNYPWPTAR
jgi:hypothetical protein